MVSKDEGKKYDCLDRLNTEQLEELLRADIESPDSGDPDVIFYILEVLEKREGCSLAGRLPDKDAAWLEFQQYYNIPEGDGLSLYPCKSEDGKEEQAISSTSHTPKFTDAHRWLMRCLASVAVVAVFFSGMIVVQAAGVDVFGAIGSWTDETFRFVSSRKENGKENSLSQEFFLDNGIDAHLVPTQIPEGFEASEPIIFDTKSGYKINVEFESEDGRFFSINISKYYSSDYVNSIMFEKDADEVIEYTHNTMTFYILHNLDSVTAVWSDGILVEQISGDLSIDEVKLIIDSIGDA